jgi:hypothetical protein
VVVPCVHGNESLGSIKGLNFLTSCATVSFSRTLLLSTAVIINMGNEQKKCERKGSWPTLSYSPGSIEIRV